MWQLHFRVDSCAPEGAKSERNPENESQRPAPFPRPRTEPSACAGCRGPGRAGPRRGTCRPPRGATPPGPRGSAAAWRGGAGRAAPGGRGGGGGSRAEAPEGSSGRPGPRSPRRAGCCRGAACRSRGRTGPGGPCSQGWLRKYPPGAGKRPLPPAARIPCSASAGTAVLPRLRFSQAKGLRPAAQQTPRRSAGVF